MNHIELLNLKTNIIKRAEDAHITVGTRTTCVLDLDNAIKQFDMRLEDWLAADDFNFAHDWVGIQTNIDRLSGRIDNLFVPRFARTKCTRQTQREYIAHHLTIMANRLISDPIEITYRQETEESVKDYTEWGRKRLGIMSGEEYFLVSRGGKLLYAVNVTADSPVTAAHELMDLLARKF